MQVVCSLARPATAYNHAVARFAQALCKKGSQRWLQWYVNDAPEVLDRQIGLGPIEWRSPRRDDDYAEYRDAAFLERLDIRLSRRSLESFWPRGGPQWDALGRSSSGVTVLVEAKAHLSELESPATAASSDTSLALIQTSLSETRRRLGVPEPFDWTKRYYQYANRIAHAYLLNDLNDLRTKLVFVYFVGDHDMKGPMTRYEWEVGINSAHAALGLKAVPSFVRDVFVDVSSAASV